MWKCVLLLYQMFTSLLTRLSCDSLRLKSTERRMIRTIIWTTWWGTSFSLRLVSYYLLMMTLYFQDSNFLSATGLLTGSVKRFSTMVRSGRDNRRILCYVSMGLVLVFFLLYYLISRIQQWLQLLTSAAREETFILLNREVVLRGKPMRRRLGGLTCCNWLMRREPTSCLSQLNLCIHRIITPTFLRWLLCCWQEGRCSSCRSLTGLL